MKNILILGGTGRVGRALAAQLSASDGLRVTIAGRRSCVGERIARASADRMHFQNVDLRDGDQLRAALRGIDLVVHAAGPFQGAEPTVLDAALEAGCAYLDIADDLECSRRARARHDEARRRGVPAMVSGGVFPGLSNVIAGALLEQEPRANAARLDFSYFVAGTGGAGPAVMASTFLLGARPATEYVGGERVERKAFSGRRLVDFPTPVGRRPCYRIELPETTSCFETYGVPDVSARFGTAPDAWNWSTKAVCALPSALVASRRTIIPLVATIMPLLRAVDRAVGDALAMRVDVTLADGSRRSVGYAHPHTVPAIATAVAAQANELLEGRVSPGVWWPEQAIRDKPGHLRRAVGHAFFDVVG